MQDWRRKKDVLFRLNPLVSIPYFKEGDLVVSKPGAMAMAICMRAGRKDLIGNSPQKIVMVRTLQSSIQIIMNFLLSLTLRDKNDINATWTTEFNSVIKPELNKLVKQCGEMNFLIGELSIVDFELGHMIGLFEAVLSSCGIATPMKAYPNLINVKRNVEDLPGVKEYR